MQKVSGTGLTTPPGSQRAWGQPVPGDLFPRVVCLVRQEYGTNKIYT